MKYRIETERADLFDVNIMIVMSVRLNTDAPLDELVEAFKKACELHEVLNTKVVIDSSGEAYYTECDSPQNSFVKTNLSLLELINENEGKRFHIEEGEFIRGFSSPDGIVFMMHHLGGDGKSLVYFIETFLSCLSGCSCERVPFRHLTLDKLPKETKLPFVYGLLVKSWNRRWQKERRVFGFEDMEAAYAGFWKDNRTQTVIKRFSKAELDVLIAQSKEAGVTLTSYFITDVIRGMDHKADVGLAVDGRTDKNRSMGNQATGISIKCGYDERESFEANARRVQKQLKKKLESPMLRYFVLHFMGRLDPTLTDALNLERAGYFTSGLSAKVAQSLGYGDQVKDVSLTNLTRADIPVEYGPYRIEEMVFVPPVISYGKNIIGMVTAGDVMTIAVHTYVE